MPRIALFQDYLAQNGGAERVTEAIHRTLPEAELYTTMAVPDRISPYLRNLEATTTWMQALPAKAKLYRHYFLLYPLAVESTHLENYDLIVSSCCGYAKGVRRGENGVHVCYCHNPMRWVWRFSEYMQRETFCRPMKAALRLMVERLKQWKCAQPRGPITTLLIHISWPTDRRMRLGWKRRSSSPQSIHHDSGSAKRHKITT